MDKKTKQEYYEQGKIAVAKKDRRLAEGIPDEIISEILDEALNENQEWLDSLTPDELFMHKFKMAMRRGNATHVFAFNITPSKESNG